MLGHFVPICRTTRCKEKLYTSEQNIICFESVSSPSSLVISLMLLQHCIPSNYKTYNVLLSPPAPLSSAAKSAMQSQMNLCHGHLTFGTTSWMFLL